MTISISPGLTASLPASSLAWSADNVFSGHVYDPLDPGRRIAVELLVDGVPIACMLADEEVPGLAIGDGCHGFSFAVDRDLLKEASTVEVRIANLNTPVGSPVILGGRQFGETHAARRGDLVWQGGLRLSGWTADPAGIVEIVVDGEAILQVDPADWRNVDGLGDRPARGFDCHLPARFADGRLHRAEARDARGVAIAGVQPFVAFRDGVAADVNATGFDALRARQYDQLVPASVSFADFAQWRERLPGIAATCDMAIAVLMIGRPGSGGGDADDAACGLAQQTHRNWVAASLPQTGSGVSFAPPDALTFLDADAHQVEIVVVVPAHARLRPDALARLADAFAANPQADAIYGDLELVGPDGSAWPLLLPAFDYERLLEQGYCCQAFALRRAAVHSAVNAGANTPFRLFNALLDHAAAQDRILHLPHVIAALPASGGPQSTGDLQKATAAHLQARGVHATVEAGEGTCLPAVRVRRKVSQPGRISVIIPTRNRVELLAACIRSIRPALDRHDAELIVIDNDSTEPATLAYLKDLGPSVRVIRMPGPFNYARLNNAAVDLATGELVLLLNNDIKARDDDWLDEMLGRMEDPAVAATGAMLVYASGVVQHAGVVLGTGFAAGHAGTDRIEDDPGYGDMFRVARDCSAVTAACLLTRRAAFRAVGGFDEIRFPINFNDVDYCLKLRAQGHRVVFTPYARLWHCESASRGSDRGPNAARLARELRALRLKWGHVLVDDPSYHPALSLDGLTFSALAAPPRSLDPRGSIVPCPADLPAGF